MKAALCLLILFASVNLARAGTLPVPRRLRTILRCNRHGWYLSSDRLGNQSDRRIFVCDQQRDPNIYSNGDD